MRLIANINKLQRVANVTNYRVDALIFRISAVMSKKHNASVRLRLESIHLRPICQFAYNPGHKRWHSSRQMTSQADSLKTKTA